MLFDQTKYLNAQKSLWLGQWECLYDLYKILLYETLFLF